MTLMSIVEVKRSMKEVIGSSKLGAVLTVMTATKIRVIERRTCTPVLLLC